MFGHVQDSFKTIKTTIKLVDFYQAALVLKNIVFFLFSKHNEHIKRSLNLRGKKNIHIIYTKNSKYYCLKHENEALKNKIFGFMCFFFLLLCIRLYLSLSLKHRANCLFLFNFAGLCSWYGNIGPKFEIKEKKTHTQKLCRINGNLTFDAINRSLRHYYTIGA